MTLIAGCFPKYKKIKDHEVSDWLTDLWLGVKLILVGPISRPDHPPIIPACPDHLPRPPRPIRCG